MVCLIIYALVKKIVMYTSSNPPSRGALSCPSNFPLCIKKNKDDEYGNCSGTSDDIKPFKDGEGRPPPIDRPVDFCGCYKTQSNSFVPNHCAYRHV